jgi:flagellar protein FlbT
MHISLRAGERIFINGAVIRVDRKVSLELMNDATFLMEAHVMRVEDATTPLKQLYFIVQVILMNPNDANAAREMFQTSILATISSFDDPEIVAGLSQVATQVSTDRVFDALKTIRGLFPREAEIIARRPALKPTQAA